MNKLQIISRKRNPVTVIIGMICKDAIVVAADSRTTDKDGIIHDDAIKLRALDLGDFSSVLIARSGNDELSSFAIELVEKEANESSLTDYRSIATIASNAMAKIKDRLKTQFGGTAIEFQKHCEDHEFSLMIAQHYKGQPYIFTIDFATGIATWKRDRALVTMGCARNLAEFLLKGFNVSEMSAGHAIASCVYCVEQIVTFDSRCGPPVRVGYIYGGSEMNFGRILEDTKVKKVSDELKRREPQFQSDWSTKMKEVIDAVAASEKTELGSLKKEKVP